MYNTRKRGLNRKMPTSYLMKVQNILIKLSVAIHHSGTNILITDANHTSLHHVFAKMQPFHYFKNSLGDE